MKVRASSFVVGVALVAVVGCSVTSPSSEPSGPLTLGIDWGRAPSVERPVNFDATLPPGDQRKHPILRIPGQATIADVVALPKGGLVAVGYIPPDWQPAAWTSPDGNTWSLHFLGVDEFTFPVALAVGADGTIVTVGRTGQVPASWTTADGATWDEHLVPTAGDVAERMTTVVATDHGFIAGGSVGPELFERHARFWTSLDGVTWTAVRDDAALFADAEVRAIGRFGNGFVAVGVVGSAQQPTGAVAWLSPDGVTWSRISDPAFAGCLAVAVVDAPFGGLVAVGSTVERTEAVAWTSADGRRWIRAPKEDSRLYPGYGTSAGFIWMTDATVVGDQVVGVGVYQGLQRGTATSWVTRDGTHWTQARSSPVQEQGEFYAVTPGGPGVVAVGSFGAPDSYVPVVWLSPGR